MSKAKPWRELAADPVLDCRVFSIERSIAESPEDRAQHEFFRIRSQDFVQIVPVTADQQVVMVRQFRHGAEYLSLECPGGLVDPGETPAQTAARECLEETGFAVRRLEPLGQTNPNPALFGNRLHSFYAADVERVGEVQNTSTERTEVVLVPADRLVRMLCDGTIDHALIEATLWRFLYRTGRLERHKG